VSLFHELWRDESAAALAEHALLIAIIVVGTIGAVTRFGGCLRFSFYRSSYTIGRAH